MKMRVKPLVVDVIEDDGMYLEPSTMTYYDKDSLESIDEHEVDSEKALHAEYEKGREDALMDLQDNLANNDIYRVPEWLREILVMAKENGKKEALKDLSEVDLEEEMDKFYGMYRDKTGKTYAIEDDEPCFDWKEDELSESDMRIARHFYKLGKARKEK